MAPRMTSSDSISCGHLRRRRGQSVRILAGESSRSKIVEIDGITERAVHDVASGRNTLMLETMTQILLVGTELAVARRAGAVVRRPGFAPIVAQSVHDAREPAAQHPPLIVVVSRALAATASAETLSIPLAPGGAFVLYRSVATALVTLSSVGAARRSRRSLASVGAKPAHGARPARRRARPRHGPRRRAIRRADEATPREP